MSSEIDVESIGKQSSEYPFEDDEIDTDTWERVEILENDVKEEHSVDNDATIIENHENSQTSKSLTEQVTRPQLKTI